MFSFRWPAVLGALHGVEADNEGAPDHRTSLIHGRISNSIVQRRPPYAARKEQAKGRNAGKNRIPVPGGTCRNEWIRV